MFLYPVGGTVEKKWSQRLFSSYISSRKELVQGNVPAVGPSGNAVDPAFSLSLSLSSLISPAKFTIAHVHILSTAKWTVGLGIALSRQMVGK